ncbi:MAG: MFS transporter [Patescibacteria group bacterium]|nr:MFS transporter [Patescibacteria group bacterium]
MEPLTGQNSDIQTENSTTPIPTSHGFKKWAPLLVLSLALMIIIIDTTILNVSLRTIINDLHTDIVSIQWVITVYSLILAAFTITGGRMGDLFGRKKMFMLGAAIFAAGSFIASISKSVGVLIGGESVVEGIGAVLMMPATASLLVANYKGRDRAVAFGVWGGIAGAASAIGPILGGWLTSNYSWRWAFRINVGVAIVLLLGSILIAESRDREEKPSLDWFGVLLSSLGLLSIVYGAIEAETYGWFKAKEAFSLFHHALNFGQLSVVPIFFVLGLALLAAFIFWELRMDRQDKTPLVSLSLFRNRQFTSGAVTTGILALGQAGLIFSIPVFLQGVRNLDAFHTGLYMLPLSLVTLIAAPFSAFLIKIISPKRLIQLGLLIDVAAFLVLRYSLRVNATAWTLAPGFVLFGLGMGLMMAQVSNFTLSAVSVEEAGEASGVNNTLRQVGATLGSAIMGAILISTLTANLGTGISQSQVIPGQLKQNIAKAFESHASQIEFSNPGAYEGSLPENIKTELASISKQATTDANKTTLGYGVIFILLGFIVSFALPDNKDVETGQSAAHAHKSLQQMHEEKIKKMRFQGALLGILLALAAGAGGFFLGRNHNKQPAGYDPASTAGISAPQVVQPENILPGASSSPLPNVQTQPETNQAGIPATSTPPAAAAPAPSSASKSVPNNPQPEKYSNVDWKISFTAPAQGNLSVQQASASSLLFFDSKTGKSYGNIQKYGNMGNESLDTIETELQGSPDVNKTARSSFAGLPDVEYWTNNGEKNIAVIYNGSIYYLSGPLISSPIAESFKFLP